MGKEGGKYEERARRARDGRGACARTVILNGSAIRKWPIVATPADLARLTVSPFSPSPSLLTSSNPRFLLRPLSTPLVPPTHTAIFPLATLQSRPCALSPSRAQLDSSFPSQTPARPLALASSGHPFRPFLPGSFRPHTLDPCLLPVVRRPKF